MVTLQEIAERAGVSPKTVSLALRGRSSVNSATARRIVRIANDLGYNKRGRGERATERFISVIIPRFNQPAYADYLQYLHHYAKRQGASLRIVTTDGVLEAEGAAIADRKLDAAAAVVLINPGLPLSTLGDFAEARADRPIAVVNYLDAPDQLPRNVALVNVDYDAGAREAIGHFKTTKQPLIGYLGGRDAAPTERARRASVVKAIKDCKLEFRDEFFVDIGADTMTTFRAGYEGFERLMRGRSPSNRPSAIVAYADFVAIGALAAARQGEPSIKVPEQVGLVSFGDTDVAPYTVPSLSAIVVPRQEQAKTAIEWIGSFLTSSSEQSLPPRLSPSRFYPRDSTLASAITTIDSSR